jgi:hypothetical protein
MKVQISNKVTGEFRIPIMDKTFRRGSFVNMSEDEFFHSATQWAIRNEYLTVIEDADAGPTKPQGSEFRLVSRNSLALRCVGRTINPGEVFYVPHDKLDDGELAVVVNRGMVVAESDFQKNAGSKSAAVTPSAKMTAAAAEAKAKSKAPSKKNQNKTVKAELKSVANDKLEEPVLPKNMYAHVPDAVKGEVKPRLAPGRTTVMLDLDPDAPEKNELSFVDKEQSDARKLNIAKDNEEVV